LGAKEKKKGLRKSWRYVHVSAAGQRRKGAGGKTLNEGKKNCPEGEPKVQKWVDEEIVTKEHDPR